MPAEKTNQKICTNGYDCIAKEHNYGCQAPLNEALGKWEPKDGDL